MSLPFWVHRGLYWYLDKMDKEHKLAFMNYGYSEPGLNISLDPQDEINRYPIQLYHHVASLADLKGKRIVEVGSGRGGGLDYVARAFSPSSARGIDITRNSVAFSNKMFRHKDLAYTVGNAQSLPLPDESCDVVLNIESSVRYLSMKAFIAEVKRVLIPGGFFLFADMRSDHQWPEVVSIIENGGLEIIEQRDITSNILQSLDHDSERREKLVRKFVPQILQKSILNFSGARGTKTYDYFLNRKFTYRSFLIQKI